MSVLNWIDSQAGILQRTKRSAHAQGTLFSIDIGEAGEVSVVMTDTPTRELLQYWCDLVKRSYYERIESKGASTRSQESPPASVDRPEDGSAVNGRGSTPAVESPVPNAQGALHEVLAAQVSQLGETIKAQTELILRLTDERYAAKLKLERAKSELTIAKEALVLAQKIHGADSKELLEDTEEVGQTGSSGVCE